jgi:hypothetical protein
MSQLTNVNRSQLLAAATAISAMGFLTVSPPVQAHPMLPLAPACNQYVFNGDFALKQSYGGVVSFNSTGPAASGVALNGQDSGLVTGGIQGRNVDFTITWGGQPLYAPFRYTGTVGDDALIHDGVVDSAIPWHSTGPLGCATPAPAPVSHQPVPPALQAPPPAPAPISHQPVPPELQQPMTTGPPTP